MNAAAIPNPEKLPVPCEVCGKMTLSQYGVCKRSHECRAANYRRWFSLNREKATRTKQEQRRARPGGRVAESCRTYAANRPRILERQRVYRDRNRERLRVSWRHAYMRKKAGVVLSQIILIGTCLQEKIKETVDGVRDCSKS